MQQRRLALLHTQDQRATIAMAHSINRTIKTCVWIKADGKPCGRPTAYTMPKDDDRNRVRSYDVFCVEHKVRAAQNVEEDTED
jgi:hypothetical protein